MKKFIIFFLMTILLLSTGYSYAEKSTIPLAPKLSVDRIDHVDGVDEVMHPSQLNINSPGTTVNVNAASGTVTFQSSLNTPAPTTEPHRERQTRLVVSNVNDINDNDTTAWSAVTDANQPVNRTYTFSTPGVYRVWVQFQHRQSTDGVTWSDWHLHTSATFVTARVYNTPLILGEFDVCQGTAGSTAQLSTADQTLYTYQWLNGDLTEIPTATSRIYQAPISAPGTRSYYVELRYGGTMVARSPRHDLNVQSRPTVNISPAEVSYCTSSAQVEIYPTYGGGAAFYQWRMDGADIPAGEGGTQADLIRPNVPARTTSYVFSVVARGAGTLQCASDSAKQTVRVHDMPTPVATVTPDVNQACVGGEIRFSVNDLGPGYTYDWRLNNVTRSNNLQYDYTRTTTGSDHVRLIVTHNTTGCRDTSVRWTIQYRAQPTWLSPSIALDPDRNDICQDQVLTMVARINGTASDYDYSWIRNSGVLPVTIDTVRHNPVLDPTLTPGVYTYQVTATHKTYPGCTSAPTTVTITSHVKPTVWIEGDDHYCGVPAPVVLRVDGEVAGSTYRWFKDGVEIYSPEAPPYIPYNAKQLNDTNNLVKLAPYVYSVQTTSPATMGSCVSNAAIDVTIDTTLIVKINKATDTVVCAGGGQITLTATPYPGANYMWFKNGVAVSGWGLPTYSEIYGDPADAGIYKYNVIARRNANCQSPLSDTVTIRVLSQPTQTQTITIAPSVPIPTDTICDGGQIKLRISSPYTPSPYDQYAWYRNGIMIPGADTDTLIDSPTSVDQDITTYTYNLVIINQDSCAITAGYTVTVKRNPTVSLITPRHVCLSWGNVKLKAEVDGFGAIGTFIFYRDGQIVASADTSTLTRSESPRANPYVYQVEYIGPNGCRAYSNAVDIMVHDIPQVHLFAEDTLICTGGEVNLSSTLGNYSISDPYVYQWYRTDTNAVNAIPGATLPAYQEVASTSGTYTYWLKVNDSAVDAANSCFGLDSIVVSVRQDPDLTLNVVKDTICSGGQVTLTATPSGGDLGGGVYTWYRNGVVISGATDAVLVDYPVAVDGDITNIIYGVKVTQAASGCESPVKQDTVTVYPNPTVVISGDPIVCITTGFSLTAHVNDTFPGIPVTYQWRRSNLDLPGEINSTYNSGPTDPSDNPYIFTVVVTGGNGCRIESEPFYQYVNTNPTVVVTATDSTICTGGSTSLTAHLGDYNSPNLTYQWYAGVDPIPGATTHTVTVNPTATTNYSVTVTQTTSGCTANGTVNITVNNDPTVTLTVVKDTICEGGQVTLTATSSGGVIGDEVYTWFKNGVVISGATNAVLVDYPVAVDGDITNIVYGVKVTQAASGCESAVKQDTVTVYPNPTVVISGDPIVCGGTAGGVTLRANFNDTYPSSGLSFQWRLFNADIPGENDTTYTHTYPASDNPYIFTVVVTGANGCVAESAPFYQYVNSNPVVVVTAT
ncbi:MAG TPA: hypothetical protein PK305_09175, partial [Bacteroidales bacterium]|nr:hypothetical protein [Bacteroidales bacterium]